MITPKKIRGVTQYMREQIAALSPDDLAEFINKTPFTAEQRKVMLAQLGEISGSAPGKFEQAAKVVVKMKEEKEKAPEPDPVGAAAPISSGAADPVPATESKKNRIRLWI